jgi:hypothetical protein
MRNNISSAVAGPERIPKARYAYYRRCQVFRKNGEQCKAPAEKGAHICYAHAREQATAFRRKLQLTILLAEVVRRMRQRGKPEFEVADIFMDFNAIQVALGVMAQAVIDGTIDCKTAGRLAIGLQTAAKVLRMIHRQGRKGQQIQPQIYADERRLGNEKDSTTKDTKEHKGRSGDPVIGRSGNRTETYQEISLDVGSVDLAASICIAEVAIIRIERSNIQRSHGPPEWTRAA